MPPTSSSLTWIQVADDAIKIGLGALIGGLFAWIVAWHNNKSAIKKLEFERRTRILSDVAQIFEDYFQAFFKFGSHLCFLEDTSNKEMKSKESQAFFDGMVQNELKKAHNLQVQMAQKLPETIKAQSQILLLGEQACLEKAQFMMRAIMDAESSYKFDGKTFDMSRFDETGKLVREYREAFYKGMQRAFKNY
jgi:hypothetical protein